jgi:hypothetical protein
MKNPRELLEDFVKFIPNHGAEIDTCPYCKKGGLIDTTCSQLEEYYKPKPVEKRDIEKKIITCPECNHTWAIAIIRGDK